MNQDSDSEEPKLIIDEDWKTQVQREKEELKRKQAESAEAEPDASQAASASADEATVNEAAANEAAAHEAAAHEELPPPPEASIPFLVMSLATQALAALGQIPDEDGSRPRVNLAYARHFIDLIGVLEEKTRGNLSQEEDQMLQETLHQMRMLFVSVGQASKP